MVLILKQLPPPSAQVERIMLQMTPMTFTNYEWGVLTSPRRLFGTLWLILIVMMVNVHIDIYKDACYRILL